MASGFFGSYNKQGDSGPTNMAKTTHNPGQSPLWDYFLKHDRRWSRSHKGMWVCVCDDDFVGFFPSQQDAIDEAGKRWPRPEGNIGLYRVGERPDTAHISEFGSAAIAPMVTLPATRRVRKGRASRVPRR